MASIWVDNGDYRLKVDDVGFLVEVDHVNYPERHYWTLDDRPARTNMSLEPRLLGWCGTTNDWRRTAHGLAIVTELSGAGDRARVRKIRHPGAIAAALRKLGYSELIPDSD